MSLWLFAGEYLALCDQEGVANGALSCLEALDLFDAYDGELPLASVSGNLMSIAMVRPVHRAPKGVCGGGVADVVVVVVVVGRWPWRRWRCWG